MVWRRRPRGERAGIVAMAGSAVHTESAGPASQPSGGRTSFDADTALARSAANVFAGSIAESWRVGRGPNGGYVAALVLRAMQLTLDDPARTPRSLTLHYLAPAKAGPCRAVTAVERVGRTLVTLSARLLQGEQVIALALAAFAGSRDSLTLREAAMPAVPPPEEIDPLSLASTVVPTITAHYDYRWAIGDQPFTGSSSSRVGGWLRLKEPRIADALLVAALMDAWMPCLFARLAEPIAAPTVDLTIHFRAPLPLPGAAPDDFYLGVFSSQLAAEGLFDETGELWSRDGQLIAQSRQLALLPAARRTGG
jgi:acyl-CoA thioesterase